MKVLTDLNNESYIGWRVKIKSSDKGTYKKVIGKTGIVTRQSGGSIGVAIDDYYNKDSSYGVYWFEKNELKFLRDESEDNAMKGFKYVAIVKLFDGYNSKDYAFALYEEDYARLIGLNYDDVMVVVNAKTKNNRMLATIKEIMSAEEYNGVNITAEVVGIVNMSGYNAREAEKKRQAELAKKKAAIEKELEAEINKRKSIEYYEAMANEYSDNPKLAELVAELKNLGA